MVGVASRDSRVEAAPDGIEVLGICGTWRVLGDDVSNVDSRLDTMFLTDGSLGSSSSFSSSSPSSSFACCCSAGTSLVTSTWMCRGEQGSSGQVPVAARREECEIVMKGLGRTGGRGQSGRQAHNRSQIATNQEQANSTRDKNETACFAKATKATHSNQRGIMLSASPATALPRIIH